MTKNMPTLSSNVRGVGFLLLGMFIFSFQDLAVKWIGGDYPVLEIVTFRSLIAVPLTVLLFRFEGRRGLPTTQRHTLEYIRGVFYFLSYTTHFMGLAALPLAQIAAIKFSGPLMITFLSVVWLKETVGPRRWLALIVGFLGVLLIVRPGSATFNMGSIFIVISVLFYALAAMLTRKLQTTDSSATMAYYSSLVYLMATCILTPISLVVGEFPDAHPSIVFLFRTWTMPTLLDWMIMSALGLIWAGGMYCISRAYSLALASIVAPFEYMALPIHTMWGFVIWREVPTLLTLAGASLTLLSGMYILHRERMERTVKITYRNKSAEGESSA
jgi:drug/metabolite transporter (DMT)-like permease